MNPHTRSGSIEGKANVIVRTGLAKVGELSVFRGVLVDSNSVAEVEMRDGVREPAFAEGLPVANVNVAGSENVPHGHLIGTSIRGGDDSDEVVIGDAEQALGL